MARVWSLDGQHLHLGAGAPVQIKQRISSDEHTALLHHPENFDSLHPKNDFLAEGVHTVFGVKDGEAQLQAFYFPADLFTPVAAKEWLQERGLEPLLFTEATESTDTPTVEFSVDARVSMSGWTSPLISPYSLLSYFTPEGVHLVPSSEMERTP